MPQLIHKQKIDIHNFEQTYDLPRYANVADFRCIEGDFFIWYHFLMRNEHIKVPFIFLVTGSGIAIPDDYLYLKSCLGPTPLRGKLPGSTEIVHLYMKG